MASMKSLLLQETKLCEEFSAKYYGICALGGMVSAGATHLAITPLDVLKVNMQVYQFFHLIHTYIVILLSILEFLLFFFLFANLFFHVGICDWCWIAYCCLDFSLLNSYPSDDHFVFWLQVWTNSSQRSLIWCWYFILFKKRLGRKWKYALFLAHMISFTRPNIKG